MKKQMFGWFTAMAAAVIFSLPVISEAANPKVIPYDLAAVKNVSGVHTLTSVVDDGNEVVITLTNVRTSPLGRDTQGEGLESTSLIALYSGIMDAKGVKEPFVIANVVNGKATFRIPNSAKAVGVPVVEHIWGRTVDGKMALVHDPADDWVVSKDGNKNLLAIGIVMCPNSRTVSLKPYGKLDQGKHPELVVTQ